LKTGSDGEIEKIKQSVVLARKEKPAYGELYPFLEALFLVQIRSKSTIQLKPFEISSQMVQTKWEEGFPLLHRWEFPLDIEVAEDILVQTQKHIPAENKSLQTAHTLLVEALAKNSHQKETLWESFLQQEWEPWDEWGDMSETEVASVLFWARSALRPSIEWGAENLLSRFTMPEAWRKGYCPVCGSLPALLFLQNEGERKGYCSWCGTIWQLHRLQCPYCDNRYHESMGYFYVESEPHYRIQYCRVCKMYFKMIDVRERIELPYFQLEEWITLHLDLLAQRDGWTQPPSPSPAVYGGRD
jgi:FdhE protein